MHSVVLVGLLLVAGACAEVQPKLGYHDNVGVPLAQKIKESEEAILSKNSDLLVANDRIVGGAIAPTNAHPYLGGLQISLVGMAGLSVCGSSLLTANRLVTAAHCWFDGARQAWQFVVVLGSQFLFSNDGTRIATSNVITHPQWTPSTLANDIAMIYLPTNVMFTNSIRPIALPSGTQLSENFVGSWSIAAGYGLTSDAQTGVSTATQVMQVNLQVITVAACQAVYGWWAQPSNICTNGAGGVGICRGDSGGPLVTFQNGQEILVGVSSFVADAGCQGGFPSAFARVTSFFSFIVQNL